MQTYQRTVKAEAAGGLNVNVTFEDGTCGVFDFTPFADYPCYKALKAPGVFACVRADHGTLAWPGEIDISPEAVWFGSVKTDRPLTVEQFVPNCGLAHPTRSRTAYAGASRARMPPQISQAT